MNLLLGIFLGVMGAAAVATVWAVRRAKDGYEDETGFHLTPPSPRAVNSARPACPTVAVGAAAGPRDVAAGVGATQADLPPGLLGAR